MGKIVLIGTDHNYQKSRSEGSAEFRTYVEKLCDQYGIAAIGEEMSEDALKAAPQSVCHQMALSNGLAHRYCDPDQRQRAALNIIDEGHPVALAQMYRWSQEKVDNEIRTLRAIRERYWLDQMIALDIWPALFVCGAEHVRYFRDLAEENGIEVIVAADDWEPRSG